MKVCDIDKNKWGIEQLSKITPPPSTLYNW